MRFFSRFTQLVLLVACSGCAFRNAPLRAVPAGERLGAQVIERKLPDGSRGSEPTRLFGTSAAEMRWMNRVRARSGISPEQMLTNAVRDRVRQLEGENTSASDGGPIVYVAVVWVAIEEIERGGFVGVSVVGAASLRNAQNMIGPASSHDAQNKVVWHATAKSTSTHFRRRKEYEENPALYAEDFREAAEDLARQLVDGPIRAAF